MGEIFGTLIFVALQAVTIASAFVVVTAQNIVRSAFALLFTFVGVAGLYVFLGADFLAATQLMVYVGGILVLLIFGVMLTHKIVSVELRQGSVRVVRSSLVFLGLVFVLFSVLLTGKTTWLMRGSGEYESSVEALGMAFMTDHLLPFEVASVLLLAALIGAVLIARREVRE